MEIQKNKLEIANKKAAELRHIASDNINLALQRGEKLEELDEKAKALEEETYQFHKQARQVKLKFSGIKRTLIILSFLISIILFLLLRLFVPHFFTKISLVSLVGSTASIYLGWLFIALMALALGTILSFIAISLLNYTPSYKPLTKSKIDSIPSHTVSREFQPSLLPPINLKGRKEKEDENKKIARPSATDTEKENLVRKNK